MQLLFHSTQAASDIAHMLRCRYDGCNGIDLTERYDTIAVRTAIELTKAEFCFVGDCFPLGPIPEKKTAQLTDEQDVEYPLERLGEWCHIAPF